MIRLRVLQAEIMDEDEYLYEQTRLMAQRLERISVDSIWARRSSGHRGALLHWLERMESMDGKIELLPAEKTRLKALLDAGYKFLERAALERLR
jgi:hypothetical protein